MPILLGDPGPLLLVPWFHPSPQRRVFCTSKNTRTVFNSLLQTRRDKTVSHRMASARRCELDSRRLQTSADRNMKSGHAQNIWRQTGIAIRPRPPRVLREPATNWSEFQLCVTWRVDDRQIVQTVQDTNRRLLAQLTPSDATATRQFLSRQIGRCKLNSTNQLCTKPDAANEAYNA